MTEWIRSWERLVFGGRVRGYRLRESVEERYRWKEHERPLSGAGEAAQVLARLGGTDVRAVAGDGSLWFTGGGPGGPGGPGEHGGHFAVHVEPAERVAGEFPMRGVFASPVETERWLAAIARTLLGTPFAVEPWDLPYDVPADIVLRSVSAGGFCVFEAWTGSRRLEVTASTASTAPIAGFPAGTWPLLIPHVLREPAVASPAALHRWLDPLVTALLGQGVPAPETGQALPETMTARVTDARRGRLRIAVGPVATRWLCGARDVVPLLDPVIYRPCVPERPRDLAAWLDAVAAAVFPAAPDEVTWSSNRPGLSSPFKTRGGSARVAGDVFALGAPGACRVDVVDADLVQLVLPTPARKVMLAGWHGPGEPALRGA